MLCEQSRRKTLCRLPRNPPQRAKRGECWATGIRCLRQTCGSASPFSLKGQSVTPKKQPPCFASCSSSIQRSSSPSHTLSRIAPLKARETRKHCLPGAFGKPGWSSLTLPGASRRHQPHLPRTCVETRKLQPWNLERFMCFQLAV